MTAAPARAALTWALILALPGHTVAQLSIEADTARPAPLVRFDGARTGPIVSSALAEVERLAAAASAPSPNLTMEQSSSGGRSQRTWPRRLIGGLFGASAGFFLGGYLGAKIEGDDCNCDDPGLKGVLIGAPIGAVVGGVLGALFLF